MNRPLLCALAFFLSIPSSEALAGEVRFRTEDGQSIAALHEVAEGSQKGAVLVPMEGGSSGDWEFFAGPAKRAAFKMGRAHA